MNFCPAWPGTLAPPRLLLVVMFVTSLVRKMVMMFSADLRIVTVFDNCEDLAPAAKLRMWSDPDN